MIRTVNIAYYEKKDWEYFLSIISDKENMHDSWDDWYKDFIKLKTNLVSNGFLVRDITININELIEYCNERNIKIDGKARSQYVQTK
jgi:hypothetical protein